MQYIEIQKISVAKFEEIQKSGDEIAISKGLIDLVHSLDDRNRLEIICCEVFRLSNKNLKLTALLCFGHIARIFGDLNKELVLPILQEAFKDGELSWRVEDVVSDIDVFVGEVWSQKLEGRK